MHMGFFLFGSCLDLFSAAQLEQFELETVFDVVSLVTQGLLDHGYLNPTREWRSASSEAWLSIDMQNFVCPAKSMKVVVVNSENS